MTRRTKIGFAVLAVVAVILPLVDNDLTLRRHTQLIVLVLAVLGVNLITGYTGLISLGHGVFVGTGAFAMANFIDWGLPPWLALIAATIFVGIVGVLLGLPGLRVRGLHLALITFGLALAFPPLVRRLGRLTGGTTGRDVDIEFMPPAFLGIDEHAQIWRYVVCLAVVAVWFWLTWSLVNSRMGRALRSVRDNELAAASFGVNLTLVKSGAFGVSAAMAGTAGALQAILFPFVSHAQFDAFLSLRLYAAAVLGGLGVLAGAIFGVIALIAVPTLNQALDLLDNESVVFGLGLVLMTFVAPDGLAGLFGRSDDDSGGPGDLGDRSVGEHLGNTPETDRVSQL